MTVDLDGGVVCATDKRVVTSQLVPGGSVSVTVRSIADMAEIALIPVPGTGIFVATGIEVIDRYRGSGS